MIRMLLGIVIGILIGLIGILFTIDYYEDRYIKLRSEVILATGTDISYPYGYDEGRLNHSWFHGEQRRQR